MQNRRTLHQPFFPLPTPSTSPSPPPSPSPSPPYPKYPFSTNPTPPFFPNYPPTPLPTTPSSSSSLPTFPANISSIIYPTSTPHNPNPHSHSKLLPALLFSLIALSLLILASAFLFHRRRRHHQNTSLPKDPTTPKPTAATSPPPPPTTPTPAPSDFLYLGTLVSSRNNSGAQTHRPPPNAASPKLGSPELHPLPPLSREFPLNRTAKAGSDDEDEFYSPRADSKPASAAAKCGLRSSVSSTPSYPTSSGSAASSPDQSSPVLASSPAKSSVCIESVSVSAVPAMRPQTPSPPKRKPPAPSPLLSPVVNSLGNSRNPFAGNPPPPPPPPPPPTFGYWESQIRKPPFLATPPKPKRMNKSPPEYSPTEPVEDTPRAKLKPLHWDKVRASSDRAMVWDQLKSSSFQVNEEMIETLFGCSNATNVTPKEVNKHTAVPSPNQGNRVLDPKKSHNIAILLRALNVTKEEVCEALLEGNTESLGSDLLETLLKMAPTKEEELKLKEHNDDSPFKLGPAEKFLKALLDVPFAFKRLDAMLYITNFDPEVSYLRNSFETIESACEELRNSRLFLKLLEAVLKTGNRMNVGTNRGDAHAFKLDTLLKLVDIKGTDGKTTLLHFVVQEIIRTEGSRFSASRMQANPLKDDHECKKLGLQVVAGLGGELSNVKKAAAMDSEVLSSYVSKLAGGVGKIADVLRMNEALSLKAHSGQFNEAMSEFLKKAEDGIIKVQAQESVALSLVKEITEYFHGNSAKEEAHPFRIFMVVRDFLSILDQVCKEVGKINERTIASSARQFPVPVNPTLPPLFPRKQALRPEDSDEDESSSSSSSQ